MTPTGLDLVAMALKQIGADGLCADECGCGLDDLAPCDDDFRQCEAAKSRPMTKDEKDEYDCGIAWREKDLLWYEPMRDEKGTG